MGPWNQESVFFGKAKAHELRAWDKKKPSITR
jgi:hypothetical protein